MQRTKKLLHDDDSAVSPVIGVILMVAITVILAAVIASFVLGLGDADDPAPNPTISSDFSSDEIELSVTGGDDFEGDVSEIQFDINVSNAGGDAFDEIDDSKSLADGDTETFDPGSETDGIDVDVEGIGDEVSAGDEIVISTVDDDETFVSYDVSIIWNPADQDSQEIYSDSGS